MAGLLTDRFGSANLLKAGLLVALGGSLLLWWNPFPQASILAVSAIGFALAPIFPALVSGTRVRVGVHHAANTIGMQIASAGFGAAVVPSLAGVLAERLSLEFIPVYLVVVFLLLITLYVIVSRPSPAASYSQNLLSTLGRGFLILSTTHPVLYQTRNLEPDT
jgi:fucose permease